MFDQWEDHFELFAFIDGMHRAYERFAEFADPARLVAMGHLVLVGGPPGVGKSSFIARCARLLVREIGMARPMIFDFGQAAGYRESADFGDMSKKLLRGMVDVLESADWIHLEELETLRGLVGDPETAHHRFSIMLKEADAVAVVILPQQIPLEWVRRFHELARPRMIFFAECGPVDPDEENRRFGVIPLRRTTVLGLTAMRDRPRDVQEILKKRVKGMSAPEMKLVAEGVVVPFDAVAEAVIELEHLFTSCGEGEITPEKLAPYTRESVDRLLARLARTRRSDG
ncbi:hypothetical protein ACFFWE_35725 [Sphaerisporangium melleum]|nr:hypothetical protein [Sphaerisporangium melleum]